MTDSYYSFMAGLAWEYPRKSTAEFYPRSHRIIAGDKVLSRWWWWWWSRGQSVISVSVTLGKDSCLAQTEGGNYFNYTYSNPDPSRNYDRARIRLYYCSQYPSNELWGQTAYPTFF